MSTATHPGRPTTPPVTAPPVAAAAKAAKRLTSPVGVAGRDRHRGAVDAADLRPARHLVPAGSATSRPRGWWTFVHQPAVHPGQLPRPCSAPRAPAGSAQLLRQLVRHHDPGGDHPDDAGAAGRVRVRLDQVPGPQLPVRRGLRPADRADPGHADPAAARSTCDVGLAGTFWPVWLSHSIFALPLAIFLLHNFMKEIPADAARGGPGRRRRARDDLLPGAAAAADARRSRRSASSSSSGSGTTCWSRSTFAGGGTDVAPITVGAGRT